MPKIIFTKVLPEDRHEVLSVFPKAVLFEGVPTEEELVNHADAEIISVMVHTKIDAKMLKILPHLKIVLTRSVGTDHIDLALMKKQNIIVTNIPDYGAHIIAEMVFALLLSSVRHIGSADRSVKQAHRFDWSGLRGIALKGKTFGVVGTGRIGLHTVRIAANGFLMNVLACDPYPNNDAAKDMGFSYVSLETLLKECDVISLHAPLTPETTHMINDETIAQMKDGVILVNTSRGAMIEEKALVKGLVSGKIAHACLDVLAHEQHLSKEKALLTAPNITITPHIAFYADDSMNRMYAESIDSIQAYLAGKAIPHRVT